MNNSQIYKKAAEGIVNNKIRFACDSLTLEISRIQEIKDRNWELRDLFKIYFKPEPKWIYPNWFGAFTEENQLARSLALLFMSEIIKSNNKLTAQKRRRNVK